MNSRKKFNLLIKDVRVKPKHDKWAGYAAKGFWILEPPMICWSFRSSE